MLNLMDAGLAITLGALATGGGALAAAVLYRRRFDARRHTEHHRTDHSSRKTIYLAYAEQFKSRLNHLQNAYTEVALAADADEQETRELLANALRFWSEPVDNLKPAEDAVCAEGPDAVAESALEAAGKLKAYSSAVHEAIVTDEGFRETTVGLAKEAYGPAYRGYIEFLYAAAETLGEDDVLRLES